MRMLAQAAIMEYLRLSGLDNRSVLPRSLGG